MTFQELALWATIGGLLNAVGYPWDSWQFWCFLATYWAVAHISRAQGRIVGIIDYLEMNEQDQQRIRKALKEAKGEQDV